MSLLLLLGLRSLDARRLGAILIDELLSRYLLLKVGGKLTKFLQVVLNTLDLLLRRDLYLA
jgi:hypothetical protein